MRLTSRLCYRHAKYYYFAPNFKWGLPKYKESGYKHWNRQMILNKNLPVVDCISKYQPVLPEGYQLENPKDIVKEDFTEFKVFFDKDKPWPYNEPNPIGTPEDVNFKQERALVFDRRYVMLEGYKGAANFTNTIIENEESLPEGILKLKQMAKSEPTATAFLKKQLDWTLKFDGFNHSLPRKKVFPKMNKTPPKQFGPNSERKEFNILNSYYEASDFLASKKFGAFGRQKIISPECVVAFKRENRKIITDLRCDFVTLTRAPLYSQNQNETKGKYPLSPFSESSTETKKLVDISPANWEICFDKTHMYSDEIPQTKLPINTDVHTIYLSSNFSNVKPLPDRFIKGRALMFMYGYAVRQARQLYGKPDEYENSINYQTIPKPITIQCMFINYDKQNIGFGCFQLNTLSFESEIKNQLWFSPMYNLTDKQVLKTLTALQLNGFVN